MAGSAAPGFIEFNPTAVDSSDQVNGAVLLPDVNGYPKDKIEIIAPCGSRGAGRRQTETNSHWSLAIE